MESTGPVALRKPRTDDRPLWDVLSAIWGYPAILVAHEMKLFEILAKRPATPEELCAVLKIARRPVEALVAVCASLGLLALDGGRYSLTAVSEDYLLPSSPTYFGWFFDVSTSIFPAWLRNLRKAVATDRPQGVFGNAQGAFAAWHGDQAVSFTRAMHSVSIAPALAWPQQINLSRHKVMLDIGGGSGAHSLGALLAWPELHAVILDQKPICEVASEFASRHGLSDRVSMHPADFFKDPFPAADFHFYGMIFHDWPPARCLSLAQKSFASLPAGGRIVVHELVFNDDRTGPFPAAAFNLNMLVTMTGQQYSGPEIAGMLTRAGFGEIQVKPTFGYWSIVTGVKAG
jgi:hypothetical protein